MARQLEPVLQRLQRYLGAAAPFRDPGVGEFGLVNGVLAVGDTFVEVVSPAAQGTTAGRYLDRLGADGGYMAIFQVPDMADARQRVATLGVRVVWTADLADMAGTHLHPKDVPGAIVSLDWADPPGSWRWAGPRWAGPQWAGSGIASADRSEGIAGLTVALSDPAAGARRWADVLGLSCGPGEAAPSPPVVLALDGGRQTIRFVPASPGQPEAITEVRIRSADSEDPATSAGRSLSVGAARIVIGRERSGESHSGRVSG